MERLSSEPWLLKIVISLLRLVSAIEINPGEYSGRISGDDTIDKWYKFERPNTYFNQIKEQVKQHVSTLECLLTNPSSSTEPNISLESH